MRTNRQTRVPAQRRQHRKSPISVWLASFSPETTTAPKGAIRGTLKYLAPEQVNARTAEAGPAADIYALGATFYECLTGRPPFHATSAGLISLVVGRDPVAPAEFQPDVPRDLETICLKCLRKLPGRHTLRRLPWPTTSSDISPAGEVWPGPRADANDC